MLSGADPAASSSGSVSFSTEASISSTDDSSRGRISTTAGGDTCADADGSGGAASRAGAGAGVEEMATGAAGAGSDGSARGRWDARGIKEARTEQTRDHAESCPPTIFKANPDGTGSLRVI